MDGIRALITATSHGSLAILLPCEDTMRSPSLPPGRRPFPDLAGTLISYFQPLVKNKFLLFISPPVCGTWVLL